MRNPALRHARAFRRWTQEDLAGQLGISASYLSEIESGKKRPSLDLLDSYARIFGIPASTFLALEEKARGRRGKKTKRAEQLLKYLELMLAEDAARASPKTSGAQDEGWLG
jgi:transcriptional regulator with XRE-family HTH domain